MVRIGPFELDEPGVELRRDGAAVPVPPLVFRILCFLVRERDRVVPKDELLDEFWGHRFVSESALAARIKTARKILGDTGQEQHMIRTVRGIGYQFVGPVDETRVAGSKPDKTPPVAIRFVEGQGGVRLAVGETGSGP
ncbi:MAG: winged helix-turn-helix domain-containing protein, partial [Woeseiaceae bacterium]|nr:winged helix-turn-helix domain-containing protein [Woeseiaceae bacterium]